MSAVMKHTMVVRNPDTMEATAVLAGEPRPDWAKDLIDDGNLEDGGSDSDAGYSKQSAADLQAEVDKRNEDREDDDQIEVEGSGSNGNVVKADLVSALEADDAAKA